jgi:hypothetical protein
MPMPSTPRSSRSTCPRSPSRCWPAPTTRTTSSRCRRSPATRIDEVFIGSCMTNIGHFRAAGKLLQAAGEVIPTRLWIAPPTKMDEQQLMEEGYYNIYATAGARTEMPGCSLCMGNQARIAANSTCVSTSTRNFPNRLGQGANVYLASAELAAIASVWASCRPSMSTWSTRPDRQHGTGDLPLHELRPDAGVRRCRPAWQGDGRRSSGGSQGKLKPGQPPATASPLGRLRGRRVGVRPVVPARSRLRGTRAGRLSAL